MRLRRGNQVLWMVRYLQQYRFAIEYGAYYFFSYVLMKIYLFNTLLDITFNMTTYDFIEMTNEPIQIARPPEHVTSRYSNLSDKYKERNADYKHQYCKLYIVRLEKMIGMLKDSVGKKWGSRYPIFKLHKLQEEQHKKCVVIGTLYKDQKLKPSLLKKISEANSLIPPPIYTHFTDESDCLFIEDEFQRYQVIGNINIQTLVTGITCALLGIDQGMGKFSVEDYCFAECRPQIERSIKLKEDRFVCFASGLDLANYEKVSLPLKLFIDWLTGFMGCEEVLEDVKRVARLIIVGNSIRTESEIKKQTSLAAKVVESSDTLNAVKKLDLILSQFVRVLNVDVMPGQHDPSNHLLAQQPMHHCMFPLASKFKTFNCVTNPYECEIDGLRFLGTSGQPVTDITSYSCIENPIDALEQCLIWNHVVPTAPDTLGSYPYYDKDPFVIENCPNVLFAGNQTRYETKLYKGPENQCVRLICIPEFSQSFSVILLNLRNLECHEMFFCVEDLD